MGTWGTGIFDNDTTCDVRDDFIDYLNEGKTAAEATKIILKSYFDDFNLDEHLEIMSLVFISLSAIQMRKNCLQEEVRKQTIRLIERGADLDLWKEADEGGYSERQQILNDLMQKLLNYK